MILKVSVTIKDVSLEIRHEAEVIVDTDEEAHTAGEQFAELSQAFTAGYAGARASE